MSATTSFAAGCVPRARALCFLLQVVMGLGVAGRAVAWDAATTHAGLTERALAASKLHAVLAHQLGRAMGAFEPLKLDSRALDADSLRNLKGRLDMLDSAGGYRPNADDVATAIAWAKAGAVLAKTPPERGRHHFFEPSRQTGLDDGPGLSGTLHAARLTLGEGASVRDAATGSAFDLEGMPATAWLWTPRNELGLGAFFDNWALAVGAKEPWQRDGALIRALLALGGVLSVLEDMGQPAFVRNDFRGEFSGEGSELESFVADRYGAVVLPRATSPVSRPDLESYFVAADGKGLAQLTQRAFFSAGTLPKDFVCVPGDDARGAAHLVNQSLRYPEPRFDTLDLRASERPHYLVRAEIKIAAYRRVEDRIHFFLDRAVRADIARAWLPEVMAYAAGLANHLLRARLEISVVDGRLVVRVSGIEAAERGTAVHVLVEDEAGARQETLGAKLEGTDEVVVPLPKGARKIAAFARGRDGAGDFVATGELSLP
jgi:hypothetical protein